MALFILDVLVEERELQSLYEINISVFNRKWMT